ncbi:MAG: CBS domain-containing protein [Candidatus Woesearchaeota archaeon]
MKNHRKNHLEKYIIKSIPVVDESCSINDVISLLEQSSPIFDAVDYIYVINNEEKLIGYISIKDLFNLAKETKVKDVMQTKIVHGTLSDSLEKIAELSIKNGLTQIPILENNKLLGVVASKTILSVINKNLKEDLLHLAGVNKSHLEYKSNLDIPLNSAIKVRIPWLLIGLIGCFFMASLIINFENLLSKYFIITTFIPVIVYLSDSIGTQTQTIFIRDIALWGKKLRIKDYFKKEILVIFLTATIINILLLIVILLFFREPYLGLIIAISSIITDLCSGIIQLIIAISIRYFNLDPAFGSGPIATVITDFISVLIYVVICIIFLQ